MQKPSVGSVPFSELGHGAQFKTYDMHNGRVLKIPLTEAETYHVARRRLNIIHGTVEEIASLDVRVQTFMNSKARIPAMVSHKFEDSKPFLQLLGNPHVSEILPEDTHERRWGAARFVYTQDKVEMANGMLKTFAAMPTILPADVRRLKRYIEDYVAFIYECWAYGYSDYVFKLGDTGITPSGSLISVDLGEWTADVDFLKRAMAQTWWKDNVNPKKKDFPKLPTSLEDFYVHTLSAAFTVEELEKRWRTKHICTQCTDESRSLEAFVSTKVAEIDFIDRL